MTIAKWREETSTAQPPYRQAKRRDCLWKPGWIQRDTFCEIQETSWMTRAWRWFESLELLWNESDSSCPRASYSTLVVYGARFQREAWGMKGGICSTVVKTVGCLQFCNEHDAKGKGSVLLRPEPIESDFAPTNVHLPPLYLMLSSSISPLYQFELEFA